jgi:hypothetical protein
LHLLSINGIKLSGDDQLVLEASGQETLCNIGLQKKTDILKLLKHFKLNTYVKEALTHQVDQILENPTVLLQYADRMPDSQLLALVETWKGKHPEKMSDNPEEAFQNLINSLYHS